MSSSHPVRLEVLPPSNKLRYEKTLIGQLFSQEGPSGDIFPKSHSPLLLRPKLEPLRDDRVLNPSRSPEVPALAHTPSPTPPAAPSVSTLARAPAPAPAPTPAPLRTPTPHREEPPARSTPELQRSAESTPPPRAASASPTSAQSESPQPKKGPVLATLVNMASKKGGKKMKIDLKKGM